MFTMSDEKGPDDKIVCVPLHDPYWNHYEKVEVGDWRSREEDEVEIRTSEERFRRDG
jgi:inorganic pyrophosphatase